MAPDRRRILPACLACRSNGRGRCSWVPAFAGTTRGRPRKSHSHPSAERPPGIEPRLRLPPQRVVALVPGEDHRVGIVGGRAEPLADLVLALDHDRAAAQRPGRRGELRREPAVGRQRDAVAADRVERLAELPPQLRCACWRR